MDKFWMDKFWDKFWTPKESGKFCRQVLDTQGITQSG
jgi:hypothetical protein